MAARPRARTTIDHQEVHKGYLQVGAAHRAYYTWKGSILEGTPIEPDQVVEFDWRERRNGADVQLKRAIEILEVGRLAQAS